MPVAGWPRQAKFMELCLSATPALVHGAARAPSSTKDADARLACSLLCMVPQAFHLLSSWLPQLLVHVHEASQEAGSAVVSQMQPKVTTAKVISVR